MTETQRKILTLVVGKAGDLFFADIVRLSGLDIATVSAAARRLSAMGYMDSNLHTGYSAYPGAWSALAVRA